MPKTTHTTTTSHPTPPPGQKKTRTKTGCLVCRGRRVRCDHLQPSCGNCMKYMADCVYPEPKAFDVDENRSVLRQRHNNSVSASTSSAKRRKVLDTGATNTATSPFPTDAHLSALPSSTTQSTHPNTSHASVTRRSSSSSGTMQQQQQQQQREEQRMAANAAYIRAICRETRMSSWFASPVPPPDFLRMQFGEKEDLEAIHHCLTYSLSIIVVQEKDNPWLWLAPLFLIPCDEAPLATLALRSACLALGATHLASLRRRTPDQASLAAETTASAARYQFASLNALRQARGNGREVMNDRFLVASAILLCDAVLGAKRNWIEIHRLAMVALRSRGGCAKILSEPRSMNPQPIAAAQGIIEPELPFVTLSTVIGQIATTDILVAMCTGGKTILLGHEEDQWWEDLDSKSSSETSSSREWESVESNIGVHRGLVSLQARIFNLVSDKLQLDRRYGKGIIRRPSNSATATSSTPLQLPVLPELDQLQETASRLQTDLLEWRFRLPTIQMSPRVQLGSLALWHSLNISMEEVYEAVKIDPVIQSSVDCVLELCLEASNYKIEYLNSSLLIAGINAISAEQRATVRSLVVTFEAQCGDELQVLLEVLEESWIRADAGADDESTNWRQILLDIGKPILIG